MDKHDYIMGNARGLYLGNPLNPSFGYEAWVHQYTPGEEVAGFTTTLIEVAERGALAWSVPVFIYDLTAMTKTRYRVWPKPLTQPDGCELKLITVGEGDE